MMPWKTDTSYLHGKELEDAQAQNRQYAKERIRAERAKRIKELEDEVASLRAAGYINPEVCNWCHDLPYGAYNLKCGCDRLYGLIINQDTVFCPECNRCMAAWE